MTRSTTEIDKIREASQIVADTLQLVKEHLVPGAKTIDLDQMAEEHIRSRGARPAFKGYYGFPASLCMSINNEVVHGIPSERTLNEGDIVGIDCGAEKNGYYGDHAITFAVGDVNEKVKQLLEVTSNALMKGIEQAKAGNHLYDIGHAVQEYAENAGFSVVRQLVGHGIGTELHEEPQVPNYGKAGTGPELRAGMVMAIEPMINEGGYDVYTGDDGWTVYTSDGKLSAHFEHTVVISNNGPEILSVPTS
ncbi:MAG: type I methionyl aminopeptidase [Candidatus Marinimicrobia bacterium]|nr:type I methionyl aminopeptidase [Candidatus Neomarinimicrobiota bacterium]MCF7827493.1 type I methionyl aminopeptidase [Candidatus Neomarinimicrobiota bacterium]MCF7882377.1 type I methionyl aminopeptidase [Candidatus Neomarinimicrobiota bacterium]